MFKYNPESVLDHVPQGQLYSFRRGVLVWYKQEGRNFPWRKKTATKYEQIVAEVLLQRTRAETVAFSYHRFIKEFPSWNALSQARENRLINFLRPLGLWRRRAASLRLLSHALARKRYPKHREELEALPGIGQYIANSILLMCHGEPRPLLDVNMARVLERVFGPRTLADIRYDPYLQALSNAVVDCRSAKEINWAILDLAGMVCSIRNPRCSHCPVSTICRFAQGTIVNV
jgi:A/G-specific adenine glycosylase